MSLQLLRQYVFKHKHIGRLVSRLYSSQTNNSTLSKSYSNTLLLPKTTFPLRADPLKSEKPFQKRTCEELYRWQWENAKGPLFVLHDGPPYANGDLHMGHALNKILKDIINRYHVSLGHRVHYVPGWDCHGLPIENKALQELGKDSKALSASAIREAASTTATREVQSQLDQFNQLGIMADWGTSSTYRTSDHAYEMRQLRIFQQMVENGLIYRNYRPVYYSPSSRSALAEAELVYKDDHISLSVFVTFALDTASPLPNDVMRELLSMEPEIRLLVWTTTPWTLTANMGIAVNPEMSYVLVKPEAENSPIEYATILARDRLEYVAGILGPVNVVAEIQGTDLIGVSYKPIFSSLLGQIQNLGIIPASHVNAETGTGLVHCAPAHGGEDYHAFQSLGLLSKKNPLLCHVDSEGKFTEDVASIVGFDAAMSLIGQEVLYGGSKAIVEILRGIGKLVQIKRVKHRYPYDWKTDKPVIVTATSQWFANLENIKEEALAALNDVFFFPPASRNRLTSFIQSRSEWCISRQRVWGVPIPALYHIPKDHAVLTSASLEHILSVLEVKGVSHWWDGPIEEFIPSTLQEKGVPVEQTWRKGTDTMDVWFDSGTSWSLLRNLRGEDSQRKHHADVCLEGSDQHRGWFQSQLLTSTSSKSGDEVTVSPYKQLITHGMVLDQEGKKMSKSLGNIISPMTIVNGGKDRQKEPAYGADVLRLWAATAEYWRDIAIGPTALAQTAEMLRKIRNTMRFVLGNIGKAETNIEIDRVCREDMSLADRYVMHELYMLEQVSLGGYSTYNFPKVVNSLTAFTNITLSSLYFDISKDCLYADALSCQRRRAIVTVLEHILGSLPHIFAPIMPHLAEEIHEHASLAGHWSAASSFFTKAWTPLNNEWENHQTAHDMQALLRIRSVVLSLLEKARGQKYLKSSLEAEVDLILTDDASENSGYASLLKREESFLKALFIVSDAGLMEEGSFGTTSSEWLLTSSVSLPGSEDEIAIRVRSATLEKCPRCWTYSRPEKEPLCSRCQPVVNAQ